MPGRAVWAATVAAGLLALAGCGGGAPSDVPTKTVPAAVDAAKSAPPTPAVPTVWPLTGVPAESVDDRPAIGVKIENLPAARPQTGLDQADMVWEEVVEGGITRFVAVYHSSIPESVGPIRSVRPMDPSIFGPTDGVLVYSGGQPPFIAAVGEAGLQSIVNDEGDGGFFLKKGKRAPHNLYGTMADFLAQAEPGRTAPPAQFTHTKTPGQATATTAGAAFGTLDVRLTHSSRAQWQWGAAENAFLRSEGTTPAVSPEGARLTAANVVVLSVEMVNTEFADPAGTPVPETKLVGSGEGLVASGGKQIAVTWSKEGVTAPLVLTGPDGAPVVLEQGRTWIELVPRGSGSFAVS
ncbi:DUF3048 domain-containing protein [Oerskovia turbata]